METNIEKKVARIIPEAVIDLTNSEELREIVNNLVKKDIETIVFDFKNVKELDSSGLGKIFLCNKIINENDGELIIENVKSEYVQKIFKMVDLKEVVKIKWKGEFFVIRG